MPQSRRTEPGVVRTSSRKIRPSQKVLENDRINTQLRDSNIIDLSDISVPVSAPPKPLREPITAYVSASPKPPLQPIQPEPVPLPLQSPVQPTTEPIPLPP